MLITFLKIVIMTKYFLLKQNLVHSFFANTCKCPQLILVSTYFDNYFVICTPIGHILQTLSLLLQTKEESLNYLISFFQHLQISYIMKKNNILMKVSIVVLFYEHRAMNDYTTCIISTCMVLVYQENDISSAYKIRQQKFIVQYFINHLAYYIVHAFPMMLNYTCIDILTERDVLWAPRNKRPEKLRDVLKEVEASFTIMYEYHFYCDNIYTQWLTLIL